MKKTIKTILSQMLALTLVFAIVGCSNRGGDVPANADQAKAKLEAAGYSVSVYTGDDAPNDYDAISSVRAQKGSSYEDGQMIIIIYCASAEGASIAYEEALEEVQDYNDYSDMQVQAKRAGNVVYLGTVQAIQDFER